MSSAVLIGINDYSRYDAEVGAPAGSSDLQGALNDVRATWALCRRLGYAPEDVRVLTSPPMDPAELGLTSSQVREATADELRDALTWLSGRLGRGLLHFSGHGQERDGETVLCPSDCEADLGNAVALREIEALLDERAPDRSLTVLLDCCNRGKLARQEADRTTPNGLSRDLVLRSSGRHELSQERRFADGWHGAFTWALARVAEQWEGSDGALRISYADLADRAGRLLSALAVSQRPEFAGPPELAGRAFGDIGRTTTSTPRVPRRFRQVWGGGVEGYLPYKVKGFGGQILGWLVVATAANAPGFPLVTESWWFADGKFPDGGFRLEKATHGDEPSPLGVPWNVQPHRTFGAQAGPLPDLPGQYYQVHVSLGPPQPGRQPDAWMVDLGPGQLAWFADACLGPVLEALGNDSMWFAPSALPAPAPTVRAAL